MRAEDEQPRLRKKLLFFSILALILVPHELLDGPGVKSSLPFAV